MWSADYQPLSRLNMRDNQVAELAWRNGILYFSRTVSEGGHRCDESPIEVAAVKDAPQQDTRILESAVANRLYILSGERTFCSQTGGYTWVEI